MSEKKRNCWHSFEIWLLVAVVCIAIWGIISVALSPQPPPKIREYTGILESVSYEQEGILGSVSATILHFADKAFSVEGYHVYQLGKTYKVVYELYPQTEPWADPDIIRKIHSVELVKIDDLH